MTTPQPKTGFSVYLALGIVFLILGITLKGMIAFIGVGTAFLYFHYSRKRKADD